MQRLVLRSFGNCVSFGSLHVRANEHSLIISVVLVIGKAVRFLQKRSLDITYPTDKSDFFVDVHKAAIVISPCSSVGICLQHNGSLRIENDILAIVERKRNTRKRHAFGNRRELDVRVRIFIFAFIRVNMGGSSSVKAQVELSHKRIDTLVGIFKLDCPDNGIVRAIAPNCVQDHRVRCGVRSSRSLVMVQVLGNDIVVQFRVAGCSRVIEGVTHEALVATIESRRERLIGACDRVALLHNPVAVIVRGERI